MCISLIYVYVLFEYANICYMDMLYMNKFIYVIRYMNNCCIFAWLVI